jgi:hypothetical protein
VEIRWKTVAATAFAGGVKLKVSGLAVAAAAAGK